MTKLALADAEAFSKGQLTRFKIGGADEPPAPMKVSRFYLDPGDTSPWDQHEVREVWIIESGRGLLDTGEARVVVERGDGHYFASNVPHRITNEGSEPLYIISMWWPG